MHTVRSNEQPECNLGTERALLLDFFWRMHVWPRQIAPTHDEAMGYVQAVETTHFVIRKLIYYSAIGAKQEKNSFQ